MRVKRNTTTIVEDECRCGTGLVVAQPGFQNRGARRHLESKCSDKQKKDDVTSTFSAFYLFGHTTNYPPPKVLYGFAQISRRSQLKQFGQAIHGYANEGCVKVCCQVK